MITADLVSYIRKQLDRNVPKILTVSKLLKAGWLEEDIEEGFLKIEAETNKQKFKEEEITQGSSFNLKVKESDSFSSDKYREPLDEGEPLAKIEIPLIKKEEPVVREVLKEEPQTEKKETPVTSIELQELELSQGQTVSKEPKVWVPQSVPVKEIASTQEENDIIVQNKELPKPEDDTKKDSTASSLEVDDFVKTEIPEKKEELKKDYTLNNLPKIAILSTYPRDVLRVEQEMVEEAKSGTVVKTQSKKFKFSKWMVIISLVVIILGLGGWAFTSGVIDIKSIVSKINIKNINIPFIKKDPRALILNNSKILSSLKSYKTETVVEVSSPSFASISAGLLSGEAVPSLDKDYIALNSIGKVNQNEVGFLSENSVLIKGSILQDFINTNIKNDGTSLYINIPDLSTLLKGDAPTPSIVKINENEFAVIPSLFGSKAEILLKKINLYKLLSSGISSYIDKETLGTYDQLIKGVKITEKGQESIKGVETYHYSVNPDRQLFKNLLNKISDRFILSLEDEEKEKIATIINSTTVDSFDVWVGKGDSTIYQYNIVLNIPLSKLVGFEDKSIGDSQIKVTWKTTYFDFNIANEVLIPEISTSAEDFVKSTKIKKIKEQVSSFPSLAKSLHKAEKSYGVKANTSGSCMSPVSGSLFSPTGHPKSATLSVGPISLLLNDVLGATNNLGSCYSSLTAWSFAVPLSDSYDVDKKVEDYSSFYCVDSKGTTRELTSLPKGTVCVSVEPTASR